MEDEAVKERTFLFTPSRTFLSLSPRATSLGVASFETLDPLAKVIHKSEGAVVRARSRCEVVAFNLRLIFGSREVPPTSSLRGDGVSSGCWRERGSGRRRGDVLVEIFDMSCSIVAAVVSESK